MIITKPVIVSAGVIAAAATTVTLDANTIILAVIGLLSTCVTGFLALRQATMAAEQKQIHLAVNSSKTALETKLDDFVKQNVELAKKVAELEENKRGNELAKAVASVPSSPVVTQSDARKGKLGDAIEELTEAAEETVEAAEKTVEHAAKVPRKP